MDDRYPTLELWARRLGVAHARLRHEELADIDQLDGLQGSEVAEYVELGRQVEANLGAPDPTPGWCDLIPLLADLVNILGGRECGRTPAWATAWLANRPLFAGRGIRIRRAVRLGLALKGFDGWHSGHLVRAVDQQARYMTEPEMAELFREARRLRDRWMGGETLVERPIPPCPS
jgi:hypothetical protein